MNVYSSNTISVLSSCVHWYLSALNSFACSSMFPEICSAHISPSWKARWPNSERIERQHPPQVAFPVKTEKRREKLPGNEVNRTPYST